MAKVGFLLDRTFDDHAFQHAHERIRQAGHEVILLGPTAGEVLHGAHGHVHATIDQSVSDFTVNDLDAVLLPAGFPRNHLRTHERILNFLRDVYAQGKPVAVMRARGFVMTRAHPGIRHASWPAVKRDLIVQRSGPPGEFEGDELIVSDTADEETFFDTFLAQVAGGPHGVPEPAFNETVESDEVARAYAPEPAPPECH